ncbi:host-nuclease inhibitor protein Gam [Haemophilus sputorum]|uniref:Host-nuclease inhibitor protein Gam n=1 Tax=Haemophilus sputorum TaxID=1078480 RepID=A0A369YD25_9PAST|nr:host-nuclease inhibitor Gam family protein [Haemophilus sputorum]RDE72699.1 host-nuclease inhibitor protein Gam [Haemophilus sputorum]
MATRVKQPAKLRFVSVEQVQSAIKEIGDLSREHTRLTTEMNDKIGATSEQYAPQLKSLEKEIEPLQKAVQEYCEANRDELTEFGKTKTANFVTGEVQWRQRPPSVAIRGAEAVMEFLQRMGFDRFIRTKNEINKDALLNEPDVAKGIAGITIKTGVEDFVIKPFEQEVR